MDLAGGTLDIWPLYLFHSGAVTVNFAVNVLTRCRVAPLPGKRIHLRSVDTGREETFRDLNALCGARHFRHPLSARLAAFFAPEGGVLIETHSESPPGAGISGSSALMVAATAALAQFVGRKLSREQIREIAQNVEAQLIRVPTGCQDYYPALYGGVNAIHLEPDGIHREAVTAPPEALDARFVLAYTGVPRQSGINNWEVFKAHINGERRVFRNFEEIAAIARATHRALLASDWGELARLMRAEWKLRRKNVPGITTPGIDRLVAVAARHGATAAKVCGAGGGGCVVFLAEPDARNRVAEALRQNRARLLPAAVAREGLTVTASVGRAK